MPPQPRKPANLAGVPTAWWALEDKGSLQKSSWSPSARARRSGQGWIVGMERYSVCCLSQSSLLASLVRLGNQGTNREKRTPHQTGPEVIRRKVTTSHESMGGGAGKQRAFLSSSVVTMVTCHQGQARGLEFTFPLTHPTLSQLSLPARSQTE